MEDKKCVIVEFADQSQMTHFLITAKDSERQIKKLNDNISIYIDSNNKSSAIITRLTWALVFVGAVQALATVTQIIINYSN